MCIVEMHISFKSVYNETDAQLMDWKPVGRFVATLLEALVPIFLFCFVQSLHFENRC